MLPPSSGGAIMGAWMTQPQMLAFAIIGGTMILFIWGRLRYDLVAILALLVSILAGTVPAKHAFSGFSDDIIIIIGSALVLSAAVARSGIIESMLARLTASVTRVRWQRSEEHTSELQSLMRISYAVFCLKKKILQYYYITTLLHKQA